MKYTHIYTLFLLFFCTSCVEKQAKPHKDHMKVTQRGASAIIEDKKGLN